MPRGFGGARLQLLLPLGAVAAAPCAARPVAGGSDGDQERASWSTLQHLGLLEEEVGAPTRWYLLLSFVSCVVLLPHLPESRGEAMHSRPAPPSQGEWKQDNAPQRAGPEVLARPLAAQRPRASERSEEGLLSSARSASKFRSTDMFQDCT